MLKPDAARWRYGHCGGGAGLHQPVRAQLVVEVLVAGGRGLALAGVGTVEPGEPVDLAVGIAQAPVGGLGVGFGHGLLLVPVHGAVVSDRGGERRGPPVLDGLFGYVGGPDLHGVAHRVGRDAGEVELGSPAAAVAQLVQRSQCEDWLIVAVAEGFDLSSPSGRAFAGMLAVMSEYERELIASRIREAMAAAKARGVRLGRPVEHSRAVRGLVVSMREDGATLQAIADRLTAEGVATPRGGRWHLATVRRILESGRLDIEATDAADRIESEALLAVESFEAV